MRYAFAVVAAVLAIGCATDPSERANGIWRIDLKRSAIPAVSLPFPGAEEQEKQIFAAFELQLRSDHSYVLSAGTGIEGTWSMKQGSVALKPNGKASGFDPLGLGDTPLSATFTADHELVLPLPTPLGSFPVTLRKSG